VQKNLAESIQTSGATVSADPLPTLSAPEGHLLPLFQNLIGNAIKYRSEQPPRIHVATYIGDGVPHFSVSDNGIGIDPEYHEQIFTVFKRLHGSQIPGTGVGLAICQKIVQRQGGRIWVESALGAGTTIHFSLPDLQPANGRNA
jgi:light-regulated signal transduction histidine kinase (bacteriophytochrome)